MFCDLGIDFNLKINGCSADALLLLADLIQQALTLTLLLDFQRNDEVLGVLKSDYSLHLEESSVS